MVTTILSVKVIGFCSKHQTKEFPTPKKNGEIIKDKDICCVDCELNKEWKQ